MKCIFRLPLIMCVAGLAFPVLSSAAESSKDQAHEYAEARKIALKDVHVQEAYQRADEKLDDRILEIDPSLKSYMDKRKGQKPAASVPVKARTVAPVRHTVAESKPGRGGYVVAKGDTLSSIAVHYDVSVASLKSANGITDERKLRVGQKLVIPAKSAVKNTTSTTPKARAAAPAAKPEPSFWDKIKSDI
ncbi:MAG: LysM peptidoglycan-binding domain-containing protein [Chthoniobacteraceae bacterium]